MHTMPDNIKMQIYSISMKCKKIHKQIYLLDMSSVIHDVPAFTIGKVCPQLKPERCEWSSVYHWQDEARVFGRGTPSGNQCIDMIDYYPSLLNSVHLGP